MFCKNCGSQIQDGAGFCPNCGMKIEAPMGQQPTGGYQQSAPQQTGYHHSPYQQRAPHAGGGVDVMGICSLSAGGLGAILGIAALVKGVRAMTGGGIIGSIYNALSGGSGIGNIVFAIVAAAISFAGIFLAKKSVEAKGENSFAKFGKILGIIGLILGAAGLVFAIIGKIRFRNQSNYLNDLYNEFSDWF